MRENMRTSWRQSGHKQDHCPSLLNHNAKYKRLLPPCCDFANGVRWFMVHGRSHVWNSITCRRVKMDLRGEAPGLSHMALVVEDGGCWGRRGWTLNADSAL